MNRNFRVLLLVFGLILITITWLVPRTSVSTVSAVDAAFQAQEVSEDNPLPTDDPAVVQPPDEPTEVPTDEPTIEAPTDEPTEVPTDEPTIVPTEVPTDEPTIEPTDVTPTDEPTAEVTETPTPEETLIPGETPTPDGTATPEETLTPEETTEPEVTETPSPTVPDVQISFGCGENGVAFSISNLGADMDTPSNYVLTLDGSAGALNGGLAASDFPVDFQLASGQSTSVQGGFGQPSLVVESIVYQPETPCLPPNPPILTASAVCTFDKGVTFDVANTGGPMTAEEEYSIATAQGDALVGTLMLATNETASIDAGYGQPALTIGNLVTNVDQPCDAPTVIRGVVWDDTNGNGVHDADEPGFANLPMNLISESGEVNTTVTNADGSYSFEYLHVANYTISVDNSSLSSDYVLSFPTNNPVMMHANPASENTTDFGFTPKPSASVTGTVWLETGNYGVRDAGEMGIAGVMVDLVDQNGAVVMAVPVDAVTGTYVITHIPEGSYTIQLEQATLFTPNGVTWNSDAQFDYQTPITLTSGQPLTNIDFGLVGTF